MVSGVPPDGIRHPIEVIDAFSGPLRDLHEHLARLDEDTRRVAESTRRLGDIESTHARTRSQASRKRVQDLQAESGALETVVKRSLEAANLSRGAASATASGLSELAAGFSKLTGALGAASGIRNLTTELRRLVTHSVDLNSKLEQNRVAFAAIFTSVGQVRDVYGRVLEGAEAFKAATAEASRQTDKLRQDATRAGLSFDDLSEAFKRALAPGINAGFSIDQIRTLTTGLTQAAQLLGVSGERLASEIEHIFEGRGDRSNRLLSGIGISGDQLRNAQKNGQLFELLTAKSNGFVSAGSETLDTFDRSLQRVKDAFDEILQLGTVPFFETLKSILQEISGVLLKPDAKGLLAPNPEIVSKLREISKAAGDAARDLVAMAKANDFRELADGIRDSIPFLLQMGEVIGLLFDRAVTGVRELVALVTFAFKNPVKFLSGDTKELDRELQSIQDRFDTREGERIARIERRVIEQVSRELERQTASQRGQDARSQQAAKNTADAKSATTLAEEHDKAQISITRVREGLKENEGILKTLHDDVRKANFELQLQVATQGKSAGEAAKIRIEYEALQKAGEITKGLYKELLDIDVQIERVETSKVKQANELAEAFSRGKISADELARAVAAIPNRTIELVERRGSVENDITKVGRLVGQEEQAKLEALRNKQQEFAREHPELAAFPLRLKSGGQAGGITNFDDLDASSQAEFQRLSARQRGIELQKLSDSLINATNGTTGGQQGSTSAAIEDAVTKGLEASVPVVQQFGLIFSETLADALDPNRAGKKSLKQRFSDFFRSLPQLLLRAFAGQAGGSQGGGAVGRAEGGRVGGGAPSFAHFRHPRGFAEGGAPAGLDPSDRHAIWAADNEWVIKARSSLMYGADVMSAINEGLVNPGLLRALVGGGFARSPVPRRGFATGGQVNSSSAAPSGGSSAPVTVLVADRRSAQAIFDAAVETGVFVETMAKNAPAVRTVLGR